MTALYPAIKPYQSHHLAVDSPHVLLVEETGNPMGIPVIVLHGGPGLSTLSNLRRFFDPEHYRIITFDQRGCGRSLPYGELSSNTTTALIEDINRIKEKLSLEQFVLFGSGWGTTLALLYAEQFPNEVRSLILNSVFLARKKDINWLYRHGTNLVYPDDWAEFMQGIPADHHENLIEFYNKTLRGDNDLARMLFAKQWAIWHAKTASLQPHQSLINELTEPHVALSLALLQTHYLLNHFFIEENEILTHANRITAIPTEIIQGRYDMMCPLASAWELHQALPLSRLSIVREAGHSDYENGMQEAIVLATNRVLHKE